MDSGFVQGGSPPDRSGDTGRLIQPEFLLQGGVLDAPVQDLPEILGAFLSAVLLSTVERLLIEPKPARHAPLHSSGFHLFPYFL